MSHLQRSGFYSERALLWCSSFEKEPYYSATLLQMSHLQRSGFYSERALLWCGSFEKEPYYSATLLQMSHLMVLLLSKRALLKWSSSEKENYYYAALLQKSSITKCKQMVGSLSEPFLFLLQKSFILDSYKDAFFFFAL